MTDAGRGRGAALLVGLCAVNELVAGVRSALDGCATPNQPQE